MKHFDLISRNVDVAPLMAQLDAHPELWDARPERRTAEGTPHAGMRDIWVRYNAIEKLGPAFNDEHVPVWYPAWEALPALRPIVMGLMAKVEGEMLGGVLITKIPPGAKIDKHVDLGWHVDYYQKFYVSLQSAPGAMFGCESGEVEYPTEYIEPKTGEVWLFDNHTPHWVENNSTIDRITLIVCIRTDYKPGD